MNKIEIVGTDESLYVHKLNNGLSIYMVPNNKVNNYYITLSVKYGSIYTNYKVDSNEYHDPKGVAHYLEHLMFNMPDGDAFEFFSKNGASANAFTTNEVTSYEVYANSNFKDNLEYLLKYVYTPYFTKELVNKERGIITEEINMYEDDPSTSLFHGFFENILIKDERRYLVAGNVNDIKQIKSEDINNIYKTFYHPQNMFVIITGNFNPEEAVAIISESMLNYHFEEYQEPKLLDPNEPFKIINEYNEKTMNVNKHKVIVGYKIPKNNFKSLKLSKMEIRMYLNILMRVNYGSTSLINEEMKSNGIINNSLKHLLTEIDDYYIIAFYAETDYPDYFINRIKESFNSMSITKEDINRKIKAAISNLVLLFDNIEDVNMEIQDDILNYNVPITDSYTIYKSLKYEDISKVIVKLKNNLQVVNVIKPEKDKSA